MVIITTANEVLAKSYRAQDMTGGLKNILILFLMVFLFV